MRNLRLSFPAVILVLFAHTAPILAQDQDCAALTRESGSQRQLAQQARQREALLRESVFRAHALHNAIIEKAEGYTPTNLHAAMTNTRNDPSFGTATPRGDMLSIHARILDNAADFAAGNEFLDIFGLQQNPWAGLRDFEEQLSNETLETGAQALRYEEAATALAQRSIDCMVALAEEARANIETRDSGARQQDQGFTVSDRPTTGTTQTAIPDAPPEGMTNLCRLINGPRNGQTINLSQESGFPVYVPFGYMCYDPRNKDYFGFAVEL